MNISFIIVKSILNGIHNGILSSILNGIPSGILKQLFSEYKHTLFFNIYT